MKTKAKMSPKKKIVIAVGAVVVVLTAALLFVSNYLVNYAIGRSGDGGDREVALEVEASPDSVEAIIETNRAQYSADIDAFAATHPGKNVTLTAADGLTLHGVRYANAENADTHRWAIVLHGYRGDHTGVLNLAMPYYEAGYQVIAPDLRACGDSDGDYVGMGWLDREDILRWIDFILADDPQAKIVIHGISMGAATTMMTRASGTSFPASCSCGSACRNSPSFTRPAASPSCGLATHSARPAPCGRWKTAKNRCFSFMARRMTLSPMR